MKSQKKSKAFTLIEVLISIIIVGIVMSTIPLLMTAFTTSVKSNVKEEIFFAQFSLLNLISAKYFDENNTIGDNYYKDLNATGGDSDLLIYKYSDNELNRKGKHQYSPVISTLSGVIYRSGSSDSVSKLGPDIGEDNETAYDDIDDYNGYIENHAGIQGGGYTLNVSVKYISDATNYDDVNITFTYSDNTQSYTNIKLITITTTLKDGSVISLSYPSCNIGRAAMLSYK